MTYPTDPYGDMVPILEASIEAAKSRHPSGKAIPMEATEELTEPSPLIVLTPADRCDNECPAGAAYRLALREMRLEFCGHHHRKHFPEMEKWGWVVIGTNPDIVKEGA